MPLSRRPFPREGEFLIARVDPVENQYVYVDLLDYEGLPSDNLAKGMIHISEISSRWIRNIRNFVRIGQRLVLRVVRVNEEKGHVDLSLRRVNSAQKKIRMKEWKYALKYENLMQFFADAEGMNLKEAYALLGFPALEYFGDSYQETIEELKENGQKLLKDIKKPSQEQKDAFLKIVDENVEISTVSIIGKVMFRLMAENGIDIIKDTLIAAGNVVKKPKETRKIKISYIAAPFYRLEIITKDYLDAENILSDALDIVEGSAQEHDGLFEFVRD